MYLDKIIPRTSCVLGGLCIFILEDIALEYNGNTDATPRAAIAITSRVTGLVGLEVHHLWASDSEKTALIPK